MPHKTPGQDQDNNGCDTSHFHAKQLGICKDPKHQHDLWNPPEFLHGDIDELQDRLRLITLEITPNQKDHSARNTQGHRTDPGINSLALIGEQTSCDDSSQAGACEEHHTHLVSSRASFDDSHSHQLPVDPGNTVTRIRFRISQIRVILSFPLVQREGVRSIGCSGEPGC